MFQSSLQEWLEVQVQVVECCHARVSDLNSLLKCLIPYLHSLMEKFVTQMEGGPLNSDLSKVNLLLIKHIYVILVMGKNVQTVYMHKPLL